MFDVIIIGAGPYGISLASYAVQQGLSYKLIGHPMDFWKTQMPQNMFIRTPYELVQFPHPRNKFSIQQFAKETGTPLSDPLPRPVFVDYALWYAQRTGVAFTAELVIHVNKNAEHFVVETDQGSSFEAQNVVVAAGVRHFKYIPGLFRNLSSSLASHTLGYTDFNLFKGKRVAVIGSGQSAWEAAALLHQAGASAELIYRRERPVYGGGKYQEIVLRSIGNIFFSLPHFIKKKLLHIGTATVPIARFLRQYVEGKVNQHSGVTIEGVSEANGKAQLRLSNGRKDYFDHVIVASGYNINLDKLPFIGNNLKQSISREEGHDVFPKLHASFESSVPGLYFAGPLSAHSHGPTFRFILGLKKTAETITFAIIKTKKSKDVS
ncbi:NAD(P)-binding domain-containing protein [Paenibacillus harenae]|uniref:NAD(P)-binding domain-containing protein n=1 Tax=Paenibacillus harenae TaxID=306543 RepID=UPI0004082327|nr:NAD(P)-binding domain-containing protein [Paenibacillus harenae]